MMHGQKNINKHQICKSVFQALASFLDGEGAGFQAIGHLL
jgi:hypothetical protein